MRPGTLAIVTLLALARPLAAQTAAVAESLSAPPPGGIVEAERPFALGGGVGALHWDDEAPYDDLALASLTLERAVAPFLRGRAGLGYGETTLALTEPADTRILSIDLQVVALADFGPFRAAGIAPYALGGIGSLVVNPVGEPGRDLPTRSQTQITWGAGALARLGSRFAARAEAVRARVRLADPENLENGDTTPIHTLRWEGRIEWLF